MGNFVRKYGCASVIACVVYIAGATALGVTAGGGTGGSCCFLLIFVAVLLALLLGGSGDSTSE